MPTIVAFLMSDESITDAGGDHLVPEAAKQGTHKPSFLREIYQCLSIAGLAIASYFVISHFVLQTVQVVGVSMVPTLQDSQQYLLNRWIYYFRAPKRNDVVVLRDPIDKGFAVKRVIGMAGDKVVFKKGRVYVNDQKLE